MLRRLRFGTVLLASGLALSLPACSLLNTVAKAVGDVSGTISGTVKDPNGAGLANATVKLYKNLDILSQTTSKKESDGTTHAYVQFDSLAKGQPFKQTTTGSDGKYAFAGLKLVDGPYILVAQNARGEDFRGINRNTHEFFPVKLGDKGAGAKIDASSVINIDIGGPVTVDMSLPANTPPAAPPAAAQSPVVPSPPPPPTAPQPADNVQQQAQLPVAHKAATANFGTLAAIKGDGSGAALPNPTTSSDSNLTVYDMGYLGDLTISNKVLLQATATGITHAKLRISHVPTDPAAKATITEEAVNLSGGKLVSDDPNGYLLAVPRDGGKTVVQLIDADGSGATSNSLAFDTTKISSSNIRPFTVILTWDKGGDASPDRTDVDLHTFDLDAGDESWFGHLAIGLGSLDLDNTHGFGPETFTGKKGHYGVSVNYWYGSQPTKVRVRVITTRYDKTYEHTLNQFGDWWDVTEIKPDTDF